MALQGRRKAYIAGGYITKFIGARNPDFISKSHSEYGKRQNPDLEHYIRDAVNGALGSCQCPGEYVDKAWIGNFVGELFCSQGHLGAAVAGSNSSLVNKPIMRVEGACASGGLAFTSAVDSIRAGTDVTLVVGAEVMTTVSSREGNKYLARAAHYQRQAHIDDFLWPALFARRIRACFEAGIATPHDLGMISVKAHNNARLNPLAHMRASDLTIDGTVPSDSNPLFLSNDELREYIRLSDCAQMSDGAAAAVICSEEGLKRIGRRPEDCIEVMGIGCATGNLYADSDPTSMPTMAAAATRAFDEAGLKPFDVNVVELHDCFTICELLALEAMGFASKGNAVRLLREGKLERGGSLPVNTGGGLLGFGHPVGATGVKQIVEIYRQMKGKCGEYQISSVPSVGTTANMGGDDKTAVVGIFRNVE
mmetsp:Transcript_4880/g.7430  ORF Transcript_4880/g.7430 Transcript_4880/m.7430 type:complete len:422 (-) Transcript_4880:220-1485(-)